MKMVSVQVTADQAEVIQREVEVTQSSAAQVLRRAVAEYLGEPGAGDAQGRTQRRTRVRTTTAARVTIGGLVNTSHWEELHERAHIHGTSIAQLLRHALELYFSKRGLSLNAPGCLRARSELISAQKY